MPKITNLSGRDRATVEFALEHWGEFLDSHVWPKGHWDEEEVGWDAVDAARAFAAS